jgi:integrase
MLAGTLPTGNVANRFLSVEPEHAYDRTEVLKSLLSALSLLQFDDDDKGRLGRACRFFVNAIETCEGKTFQERWNAFEQRVWPKWMAIRDPHCSARRTWGGAWVAVVTRHVRPTAKWVASMRVLEWIKHLPDSDPLVQQRQILASSLETVRWAASKWCKQVALTNGLRILLVRGYSSLAEITEEDLAILPYPVGADLLDCALCGLGVFGRTPRRASRRRQRQGQLTASQMVVAAGIPERFRLVSTLYLETYATRISDAYATRRNKALALSQFWRFISGHYPDVDSCRQVLPAYARAFIADALQRKGATQTAHAWVIAVRTFFADICGWASEPDSPFSSLAPQTMPLTRHDLMGSGFKKARQDSVSRITTAVYDLEREMPNMRAFARQRWQETASARAADSDGRLKAAESRAFWNWAILELLVQSGLRIEEAGELTTLDILKRRMRDGRLYYMLHVKPSKYDRARVIPIGDGLGRVLAEIIRHVKSFYGMDAVPFCDNWDHHERRELPRAPYLLQGAGHPSAISRKAIGFRLRAISRGAGARRSDGKVLELRPHDCRRVFASEHLNNNTPVHVIQALLGHATMDSVMVYAKLYPQQLVDEYRKTVRGLYNAVHGEASFRNPTVAEWAAFEASCSMRDMGTHLCTLPTGEHCPKGLVCLGCVHAQPKKSALPIFRRMLASHQRELAAAKGRGEPAGQVAARELEVTRINSALQRAEELTDDVAAAIEAAAGVSAAFS